MINLNIFDTTVFFLDLFLQIHICVHQNHKDTITYNFCYPGSKIIMLVNIGLQKQFYMYKKLFQRHLALSQSCWHYSFWRDIYFDKVVDFSINFTNIRIISFIEFLPVNHPWSFKLTSFSEINMHIKNITGFKHLAYSSFPSSYLSWIMKITKNL